MNKGILCLLFFVFASNLHSQSITPFTVNIAGFTAQKSGYSLTVSTGEAISITNFTSPNGASLNSGFLQNNPPLVTSINDVLSVIGNDEIIITPNPTKTTTNIYAKFNKPGNLQFQILDVASKQLFRSPSASYLNAKQTIVDLTPYPAGVYYIQVMFKPASGPMKSGIYKIIKL
jgi:hypothetical protein